MNDPTQSASNDSPNAPSNPSSAPPFDRTDVPPGDSELEQVQLVIDVARAWVQEHQTAAMLGAFAFGAFIGALMRD